MSLLPKIELHLHLDCSLSFDIVKKLQPSITRAEYESSFIAPAKCIDLADYITRAIKGIELMQTRDQLEMVTKDLFEQLAADNVIYAEIRFAPLEHLRKGLQPTEVVKVVERTVSDCVKSFGLECRVILCTLRHYSERQSMDTVKLVEQFSGTRVAGLDIAADEAGFPIDNHKATFAYARERGIHCTAHAGEARGSESVWEALNEFRPQRIGHGVRSIEDQKLIEYIKQHRIHLEVCPTSNIQTNVYHTIVDHPVDRLYRSGVSMSINTDTRTISNTTLEKEYALLEQTFNWDQQHLLHCNLEAIKHAFIEDGLKRELRRKIISRWPRQNA